MSIGYTQFWRDERVSLGLDRKILLTEGQIPKSWYCILPDLPAPLQPLLDPKTREPVDPKMLEAIFPKELIRQEVSGDRFVQIPEEIREVYRLWRPTTMYQVESLGKVQPVRTDPHFTDSPMNSSLGRSLQTGKDNRGRKPCRT